MPNLLEMLSLKVTIVTTDALSCQRAVAQQIVDQGGNSVMTRRARRTRAQAFKAKQARVMSPIIRVRKGDMVVFFR